MKILVTYPILERFTSELERHVQGQPKWRFVDWRLTSEIEAELADTTVFVGHILTPRWAGLAPRLGLVQVPGAGTDAIAHEHLDPGIVVKTVGGHGRSVAEFVLLSMLALSRGLCDNDASLRRGVWRNAIFDDSAPLAETLARKRLLMLGYGEIGHEVVRLVQPLGMSVSVLRAHTKQFTDHDRRNVEFAGGLSDLSQCLPTTDFLVLALPLNQETQGIIGAEQLALLPSRAHLINVGRGPLVAEDALYEALVDHQLAGAALDVWYSYPTDGPRGWPSNRPFWALPNVLLSPHASGSTVDTFRTRAENISKNIELFRRGQPLTEGAPSPKR